MASRRAIQGRVEGLEESRAALERIVRAEIGAIPRALELIGEQGVTEIRRFAPVAAYQGGTLRRSYTYEVGQDGRRAYVEISSNVVYAAYQEYGTSRQPGTPHVRPGIDAIRSQISALVAEAAGRAGLRHSITGSIRATLGRLAGGS